MTKPTHAVFAPIWKPTCAAFLCLLLFSSQNITLATTFSFTTLDNPLGANGTDALSINNNSTVIGTYTDSGTIRHGYTFDGSTFTTFDDPLGPAANVPRGIQNSNIVGVYTDPSNIKHGYLYDGSTFTTIDHPLANQAAGLGTEAHGIYQNQIVGTYSDSNSMSHGYIYNTTTQTFTTIDDPFGVDGTIPTAISGATIVGAFVNNTNVRHGFIYNGSTYTTINDPSGNNTQLLGIDGNLIVGVYNSGGIPHGLLYDGSTFTTLDDPLGVKGTVAFGISGNTIVGQYFDSANKTHAFEVTVPEPTCSLALLTLTTLLIRPSRKNQR